MASNTPDIFSRTRRSLRRRATRGTDFFGTLMAEALLERLDDVDRRFASALVLGDRGGALDSGLHARGLSVRRLPVDTQEDGLDMEPGSQPLILWAGGMESVNDVPQALLRLRLALAPDGLLLAAGVGDGSFACLRAALRQAPHDAGRAAAARVLPQLSLGSLGDLALRVGLALPVVDVDSYALRYRNISALVRDLRGAALTSVLAGQVPPLSRAEWAAADMRFMEQAGAEGTVEESLRILHLSGWGPHPDQPQPARRGSATASLATALRKGGSG